jgi:K+-transporting ATPase ATPase C chain
MSFKRHVRAAFVTVFLFLIITGLAYPAFVAVAVHVVGMGWQADGSLIVQNGTVIASELIGENFSAPYYFWPRVSSVNYNSLNGSGGSEYGIMTLEFYYETKNYTEYLIKENMAPPGALVPANGVEPSASGFDPDISVGFALFQLPRVMNYTHLSETFLKRLISKYTHYPILGFIGSTYVNVVQLDIALHNILVQDGVIKH